MRCAPDFSPASPPLLPGFFFHRSSPCGFSPSKDLNKITCFAETIWKAAVSCTVLLVAHGAISNLSLTLILLNQENMILKSMYNNYFEHPQLES